MRLFLLVAFLAGCGGGGGGDSPTANNSQLPTVRPEYATDYQPQGTGSATAVRQDTREPYTSWSWRDHLVRWGDSVEHHTVRHCQGEDWYWIDGYSPISAPEAHVSGGPPRWPVETVRAEWHNVDTGSVRDISHLCRHLPQPFGQAYFPNNLPASGEWEIRVWGWVWSNGKRDRKWFWLGRFKFGLQVHNPCWSGPEPTRKALETREVWVDDHGNVRGSMQRPAWSGDTPVDPGEPSFNFAATNALGVGPLWTFTDQNGIKGCRI